MNFYILEHYYKDNTHSSTKMIGIYSTEENAQKTIEELKKMPGFKKYPNGFIIQKYKLDEDHFINGFDLSKDEI